MEGGVVVAMLGEVPGNGPAVEELGRFPGGGPFLEPGEGRRICLGWALEN